MELTWKAIYSNDKSLNQYNEGKVSKYTDIDRKLLKFFELYNEGKLFLRLHLGDGKRLIYRKRVSQEIGTGKKRNLYLVGWQKKVKGENIQSIVYIFEDGHIEIAGKWDEESRFFYSPNLIKEEAYG